MPSVETSDLRQCAVYWAPDGSYDGVGNPTHLDPVNIRIRVLKEERVDSDPLATPSGKLYKIAVCSELGLNGLVWFGGEVKDLPEEPEVLIVVDTGKVGDVNSRKFRYRAELTRYKVKTS